MPAISADTVVLPLSSTSTRRRPTAPSSQSPPPQAEGEGFPVRRAFAGVDSPSTPSCTWTRWARSTTPRASPRAPPGTPTAGSRP